MSFAIVVMRRVVRRLLIVQILLTLIITLIYLFLQNSDSQYAALYGGSITISGTLLMAWRIARAGEVASKEQQQGYIEIYIGAIQKFILTLVLMAFGMGYLKLDPLAILVSFAVTQLSFIANKVDTSHAPDKKKVH
ncbi:MAG: ATP synthase subunit I [gamma proteobacterium symbiont of Bathyaustriella thionipta]|nr:ATP synthase subunit I [gamma proteobacterium symbiont of Bathyaustriella thionipta]MCU7949199.1 ATP synthase subunit I [gamma proteobacterium symbiont of Bathyaustriella thionipta]MCU7952067.1 ATP synthase subunit I [gamma proteobacterium symbiont of Bathyaustriella thionipta]MCU7955759.1 ATP synthase subunit I [gamma proteobacterium symbiont of Bathyaustriella thionipta]MCU7965661.1 ATP synthase subunit I [gamma proteobacterium symbiont of Bathyaustriella thionipta]